MSAKADKGAAKGGGNKMMPIIVGVVLLVVGLVVGKTVFGAAHSKKDEKPKVEYGATIALDEFLVNLNGGDHYLKTSMSVAMKKGITEEQAKDHIAPMRDAILTVLSTKSQKDLSSPANRESLKDELKSKANEAIGEDDVEKVYITAFATQ